MLKALLLFSELQEGKRDRGAPRKRYKDQVKKQLAQASHWSPPSTQQWLKRPVRFLAHQQEASDGDSWRLSVRKTSQKAAKERRGKQKDRGASLSSSAQIFSCPKCSRVYTPRIGQYSHQRASENWPSAFPSFRPRGLSHQISQYHFYVATVVLETKRKPYLRTKSGIESHNLSMK